MTQTADALLRRTRLAAFLEHVSVVQDHWDMRRILHPLPEILLLVVCGTITDCDDYEDIAAWARAHVDFLRKHLPYEHGAHGDSLGLHDADSRSAAGFLISGWANLNT